MNIPFAQHLLVPLFDRVRRATTKRSPNLTLTLFSNDTVFELTRPIAAAYTTFVFWPCAPNSVGAEFTQRADRHIGGPKRPAPRDLLNGEWLARLAAPRCSCA